MNIQIVLLYLTFSITPPITSLSFGIRHIASEEVKIHYSFTREIIIGKHIAEKLLLPQSTTIHAFTQNQTIIFGPLIGIFTTGFNDDSSIPLGNRSIALSELLTPPFSLRPFVFVFGVQHINWEEETIEGYFFQEKQWIKKRFLYQMSFTIDYQIDKQKITNQSSEQKKVRTRLLHSMV